MGDCIRGGYQQTLMSKQTVISAEIKGSAFSEVEKGNFQNLKNLIDSHPSLLNTKADSEPQAPFLLALLYQIQNSKNVEVKKNLLDVMDHILTNHPKEIDLTIPDKDGNNIFHRIFWAAITSSDQDTKQRLILLGTSSLKLIQNADSFRIIMGQKNKYKESFLNNIFFMSKEEAQRNISPELLTNILTNKPEIITAITPYLKPFEKESAAATTVYNFEEKTFKDYLDEALLDQVTYMRMTDPQILPTEGHTFSKSTWGQVTKNPMTNKPFNKNDLKPNDALAEIIRIFNENENIPEDQLLKLMQKQMTQYEQSIDNKYANNLAMNEISGLVRAYSDYKTKKLGSQATTIPLPTQPEVQVKPSAPSTPIIPPPRANNVNMKVDQNRFYLKFNNKDEMKAFLESIGGVEKEMPDNYSYRSFQNQKSPQQVDDLTLSFPIFKSSKNEISIVCPDEVVGKLQNALGIQSSIYNNNPNVIYIEDTELNKSLIDKKETIEKPLPIPTPELDQVKIVVRDDKLIIKFDSIESRTAFLASMGGQKPIDENHPSKKYNPKSKTIPKLEDDGLSLSFDSYSSTLPSTNVSHLGIVCANQQQTRALITALDSSLGAYNPNDNSPSLFMDNKKLLDGEIVTTRQFLPIPEPNHVSMGVKEKGNEKSFYIKFNNENDLAFFLKSIGGKQSFNQEHDAVKNNINLKPPRTFPEKINGLTLSFPCYETKKKNLALACISPYVSKKVIELLDLEKSALTEGTSTVYINPGNELNNLLKGEVSLTKYNVQPVAQVIPPTQIVPQTQPMPHTKPKVTPPTPHSQTTQSKGQSGLVIPKPSSKCVSIGCSNTQFTIKFNNYKEMQAFLEYIGGEKKFPKNHKLYPNSPCPYKNLKDLTITFPYAKDASFKPSIVCLSENVRNKIMSAIGITKTELYYSNEMKPLNIPPKPTKLDELIDRLGGYLEKKKNDNTPTDKMKKDHIRFLLNDLTDMDPADLASCNKVMDTINAVFQNPKIKSEVFKATFWSTAETLFTDAKKLTQGLIDDLNENKNQPIPPFSPG